VTLNPLADYVARNGNSCTIARTSPTRPLHLPTSSSAVSSNSTIFEIRPCDENPATHNSFCNRTQSIVRPSTRWREVSALSTDLLEHHKDTSCIRIVILFLLGKNSHVIASLRNDNTFVSVA